MPGLPGASIPPARPCPLPTCVRAPGARGRTAGVGGRARSRRAAAGGDPASALPREPSAGAAHWRGSRGARRGGGGGRGGASPGFPSPPPARARRRRSAPGRGESPGRPRLGAGPRGGRFGLSPPRRPPAPARRPPPAPARGLERASLAARGLASRRRSSCGSRREHQPPPPPRELLRPHHAGAGHRDRGPSPALRSVRVSSGAPRAGARGRGDPRVPNFVCATASLRGLDSRSPPRPVPGMCPYGTVLVPFLGPWARRDPCTRTKTRSHRHPHRAGRGTGRRSGPLAGACRRLRTSCPGNRGGAPGSGRATSLALSGSFSSCAVF